MKHINILMELSDCYKDTECGPVFNLDKLEARIKKIAKKVLELATENGKKAFKEHYEEWGWKTFPDQEVLNTINQVE